MRCRSLRQVGDMTWLNESLYEDWNEFNLSWTDNQSACAIAVSTASSTHPLVVASFKVLAMSAIIVAAVSGNLLVIISALRFQRLRIIANSFLVSIRPFHCGEDSVVVVVVVVG